MTIKHDNRTITSSLLVRVSLIIFVTIVYTGNVEFPDEVGTLREFN